MRRHATGLRLLSITALTAAALLSGCSSISLSRAPVESRENHRSTQRTTPPVQQHRSGNRPIIVDSSGNVINSSGQTYSHQSPAQHSSQTGAVQSYPVPSQPSTATTHSSPYPPGSVSPAGTSPATATAGTATDYQAMAGQPGYYTVRAGDNIYRIGLNNSQRWQDIAAWNNLQEPYTISIGQVLRVAALPGEAPVITASPVTDTADAATASAATPASAPAAATGSGAWMWPAKGKVISQFNGISRKGINISGKRGDAVQASRAGTVVYAGEGLPGYGKLIIVKHDETYLTAYAHNSKLLVRENQRVSQGQQIAEMGKSDASHVMLHFEVRKDGKPVNPMKYLKK